jgi:hypothetical protein
VQFSQFVALRRVWEDTQGAHFVTYQDVVRGYLADCRDAVLAVVGGVDFLRLGTDP